MVSINIGAANRGFRVCQSCGAAEITVADPRRRDPMALFLRRDLAERLREWVPVQLPMPEVGYEAVDERGEVVGEFEAAWPQARVAIVLNTPDDSVRESWRLITADAFLERLVTLLGFFQSGGSQA